MPVGLFKGKSLMFGQTLIHTLIYFLLTTSFSTYAYSITSNANWFRQSAISPDGKTILFASHGDIYKVSSDGGDATPLITSDAWDGNPIWSKNGKYIAFASDRNSNLDVYIVKAEGGESKRLTFHSTDDTPTDFTLDGKNVLFTSARMPPVKSSAFPTSRMPQLYSVNIDGGTPFLTVGTPTLEAKISPNGKSLVYMDNKGYENLFRKHDSSSFARDIWRYDFSSKKHRQLTTFTGGDSSPAWTSDAKNIYYLSEQGDGNFNVWKMNSKGQKQQQISAHKTHPVRSLSISDNNLLAYSYHGNIYTLDTNKKSKKLAIKLIKSTNKLDDKMLNVANKVTEFSISPNGKEIAFIARGEIYVTAVDYNSTVRITHTPEQERSVSWLPDSRGLIYASERNNIWGLYQTSIADEKERYFFSATKFTEKVLLKSKQEAFQPKVSPDGKQIAYIKQRDEISVLNLASQKSHTVFSADLNYSYEDGDIKYDWSPDSRWITASFIPYGMYAFTNIGIAPADGSNPPKDISLSGYGDINPLWISKNVLLFASSRFGRRNHGSWGSDWDVMGLFLTQKSFDNYQLNKEERELFAELEKEKSDKDKKKEKKTNKDKDEKKKIAPVLIDWKGIEDRTVRLTMHSSDLTDMALTPKS
jgi:Tol biopolymer transport system component